MNAETSLPPIAGTALRSTLQAQALISFLEQEDQPMIVLGTEYNILAANTAYQRQFATADTPYIGRK